MKNIGFLTLVILTTVLLTLPLVAPAAPKTPAQPAAIAAPSALAPAAAPEPHPEIRAALEAMRNAKEHLQKAVPDYHGHRVAAIKHLDAAIHEAEICMQQK
jgi:hypothetical protein